ncbi:YggS family pyridoxal phosphate-dependent enzyme [Streptococcus halotolerans]|uniref:YggS family pyridoxal phosphate-dependent enzyme n=1 Tax=Streptococcus halotolerans TaxID=1814128 RepID=UPI00078982E6|nr:YggS family pyridoxal phosphate-dependent enzyme [Streptococcus halotolerans]
MDLANNKTKIFSSVADAIESSNNTQEVNVIAVTKYVEAEVAHQLVDTGVRHIGENRVDKFLDKYHALADQSVTWHLIGSLQRRKVKDVINLVDYFHALDSVKLAKEINKRADHPINCFLQVNLSEEPSKHGFLKSEIEQALLELAELPNINLVGLMTMAPLKASQAELDILFEETYQLKEDIKAKNIKNMPMTDLSMGMSGDYLIAIKHGATFVRIGTAFFQ